MDFYNDFYVPVLTGQMDEHLDAMVRTIQNRKKEMAPKVWEFQVGDKVRLVNANPKYLVGAEATVTKVNRTKIVIDLDSPQGRFSKNISTPLSMVEKV